MKSMNKYTVTVRRESFIKSIRNQQRQQIKAQKRAKLLERSSFSEELWRFKISLHTLDLSFEQARAMQFLQFIQEHSHSQQLCNYIRSSLVLEEFIELVTKSLHSNPQLEIPLLVQKLFDLIYQLLARSNIFLSIIEKQFNLLVFALYRYPCSQSNLDKVSQFFTCVDYMFNSETWRDNYERTKLVCQEGIMQKLMNIYIYQNSYIVTQGEFQIQVIKRTHKWFKNAIKCLQIVYSLIQIHSERSAIWQAKSIKESLYEGLNVFINEKEFFIQNFQSETTDSDSMGEGNEEPIIEAVRFQSQETNLYFISLILDILLIKQKLLEQRQIHTLKGILQILLKELNKYSIINLTAIKIIKILYEQVIFNEQDLMEMANNYQHLTLLIESIIQNDNL